MEYFISIFLGNIVLEDVALISALALIAQDKLSLPAALLACFLGINVGNILCYLTGYVIARLRLENRFMFFKKHEPRIQQFRHSNVLTYWIILCRFIPGVRIPTYLGAGFLKYPLGKFLLISAFTTLLWTLFAIWGGNSLLQVFEGHLVLSIVVLIVLVIILSFTMRKILKRVSQ